jgi:hypothetical protein
MVRNCLMVMIVVVVVALTQLFFLNALFQMNFRVSLLFVGSREFSATRIARERLFTCMSTDMSCEMIRSREGSHADAALEGLLT